MYNKGMALFLGRWLWKQRVARSVPMQVCIEFRKPIARFCSAECSSAQMVLQLPDWKRVFGELAEAGALFLQFGIENPATEFWKVAELASEKNFALSLAGDLPSSVVLGAEAIEWRGLASKDGKHNESKMNEASFKELHNLGFYTKVQGDFSMPSPQCVIDRQGDVLMLGKQPLYLGNLHKKSFDELWFSARPSLYSHLACSVCNSTTASRETEELLWSSVR